MDERKGLFTKEQLVKLDEFIKLEGIYEAIDGPALKLLNNILLNKIKLKLQESNPELLDTVYAIVDEVLDNI